MPGHVTRWPHPALSGEDEGFGMGAWALAPGSVPPPDSKDSPSCRAPWRLRGRARFLVAPQRMSPPRRGPNFNPPNTHSLNVYGL